ncbi:MAG TPA: hypothetical protein DD786_10085 [Porphyromonadaceae bacterium]|jgi:hypothetical protein|nr:hypothetical protein [Porphyromonadaceae bacterium]
MKKRLLTKLSFCFLIILVYQYGCTEFDDFKKYIPDGEIIYTSKVDSVMTYPGNNRIKLSWINKDLRISKYVISWNNNQDYVSVNVDESLSIKDTISTFISDIEESDYEFTIISYDNDNNKSVKSFFSGKVYGENYRKTLMNRGVKIAKTFVGSNLTNIEWHNPSPNEVGIEMIYTSHNDVEVTKYLPQTESITSITDYKEGTPFKFRTLYLPEPIAIDTFYTDYEIYEAPTLTYQQLDKSKFRAVFLPGDANDAWGWVLSNLWDNNVGTGFHTSDLGMPIFFTIDLGVNAILREIRTWQRLDYDQVYQRGNIKNFEIWGSNNPSIDGSFDSWTKLIDCTSYKPSSGTGITEEDVTYASAGELYVFPLETPSIRYIRFKILEAWWPDMKYVNVMELDLKGILIE